MILTKEEVKLQEHLLIKKVCEGALFIYPTDTIYGIGCNACDDKAVRKLRDIKKRPDMLFSVIAPSKDWIRNNCVMTGEAMAWLDKLPGPYTLVLKLKDSSCIAPSVNQGSGTLGVRIPDHWIKGFVENLDFPVVTTSANVSGKVYMTKIDDLDEDIRKFCSFIIYEGQKKGSPSDIIDLSKGSVEVKRR
ncbi:threonylcarbamoyl-AMP synthase [Candidatus Woesearchaeota archaeon]|nr:threonylcarbamoyl-AMP synthase [Candidatus Woesearchaeota archaeon]